MSATTYYEYGYIPKFYTMFDWNSKPLDCFKDWSQTVFSNAVMDTNSSNKIKQLYTNIEDKNQLNSLLKDNGWSRRFLIYCYGAYMQEMLICRLEELARINQGNFSIGIKVNKAVKKAVPEYEKIFSELSKDMDFMKLDGKTKKFHIRFAEVCASKAVQEARQDESHVLDMLILNDSYDRKQDGLLRLEMFISANEQG